MNKKILIIDSELDTVEILGSALRQAGFDVLAAHDGSSGLTQALTESVSLVVLDVGLPVISGFEVCRQIKKVPSTRRLPVIILTAKASEQDRIRGLEVGADDYVTKPFSLREFVLRITRSIGRAAPIAPSKPKLRVGEFEVDELRHEVRVRNEQVKLTALEFRLITLLMENAGYVLERGRLLETVWGYGNNVTTRTVDTHVMRLRAKLGDSGEQIETVRGVGYRLRGPEDALAFPSLGVEEEYHALALR
jgi:two-component system phosphate regulon response regulator PhoB